jgi:4-hydroxybenzoate polyprenyltransferase
MSLTPRPPLTAFARPPVRSVLLRLARAPEWWGYKFGPVLATAYATTCLSGAALLPQLPRLLLLLLALTVGAIYVSILNDWTDRAQDAVAGKLNPLAGRPASLVVGVLAGCAGAGLLLGAWFWRYSPAAAGLYLGAWVAYTLYSLPPLRLKQRGAWGLLADAAGAHVLPQLLTATLLGAWVGKALPPGWLVALGLWALGCGVRNILWHQLGDAVNDTQAGVKTFVVRRGRRAAHWLARAALLLEAPALLTLLGFVYQPLVACALLLYAALTWLRVRVWQQPLVIAQPQPGQHILLNDYYEVYYPLALLLVQVGRFPADGWVLAFHLLLFGLHSWHRLRLWGAAGQVGLAKIRHIVHGLGN